MSSSFDVPVSQALLAGQGFDPMDFTFLEKDAGFITKLAGALQPTHYCGFLRVLLLPLHILATACDGYGLSCPSRLKVSSPRL